MSAREVITFIRTHSENYADYDEYAKRLFLPVSNILKYAKRQFLAISNIIEIRKTVVKTHFNDISIHISLLFQLIFQ